MFSVGMSQIFGMWYIFSFWSEFDLKNVQWFCFKCLQITACVCVCVFFHWLTGSFLQQSPLVNGNSLLWTFKKITIIRVKFPDLTFVILEWFTWVKLIIIFKFFIIGLSNLFSNIYVYPKMQSKIELILLLSQISWVQIFFSLINYTNLSTLMNLAQPQLPPFKIPVTQCS